MNKDGILIIVSGPSGSGKGTVVEELIKEDDFALSISATTRSPRPYEKDGEHYFFRTRTEFEYMKESGQLLEWACFCDNFYGTPKSYVEKRLKEGKNVILEIEVQGALKVKQLYSECILVFMMPPSMGELEKRLINRGTEDADVVHKRIMRALEEIEIAKNYDYVVINNHVEQAKDDIKTIVKAEYMRCSRNKNTIGTFRGEI